MKKSLDQIARTFSLFAPPPPKMFLHQPPLFWRDGLYQRFNKRNYNIFRQTFNCSGSQESRVSDRTLDRWTPRLLSTQTKNLIYTNKTHSISWVMLLIKLQIICLHRMSCPVNKQNHILYLTIIISLHNKMKSKWNRKIKFLKKKKKKLYLILYR